MSGEHWPWPAEEKLVDTAYELKETFELLAVLHHELNWGLSGDSCLKCAYNRMAPALVEYFDGNYPAAKAIARDHRQYQCDDCYQRDHQKETTTT